jgi:SecA DEAD-like domain
MAAATSLPTSISKPPSLTAQSFLFSRPQFITKSELRGSSSNGKSQKLKSFSSRRHRKEAVRASLSGLIGGLFKSTDTGEGTRKKYQDTVNLINGMESEISNLSDSELRERTAVLKERAQNNESLDSLLPVRISCCFYFLFLFPLKFCPLF